MPTKKKTATAVKSKKTAQKTQPRSTTRPGITFYAKSSYRWVESYTSLLMGVVVVIIAVLFAVSLIRNAHHIKQTSSTAIGPSIALTPTTTAQLPTSVPTPTPEQMKGESKTYTVKPGDDLWHIALAEYGNGYKWVDIARANNLVNPGDIFSGNVLVIPTLTPEPTVIPSPVGTGTSMQQQSAPTTDTTYTVKHGDDLWHIALAEYGNGYKWVDIARANNLVNPGLIFSGNVLQIPR